MREYSNQTYISFLRASSVEEEISLGTSTTRRKNERERKEKVKNKAKQQRKKESMMMMEMTHLALTCLGKKQSGNLY
jgi:hypothetical protein